MVMGQFSLPAVARPAWSPGIAAIPAMVQLTYSCGGSARPQRPTGVGRVQNLLQSSWHGVGPVVVAVCQRTTGGQGLRDRPGALPTDFALVPAAWHQQHGLVLVLLTQIAMVHVSFISLLHIVPVFMHGTTTVSARHPVVRKAHSGAAHHLGAHAGTGTSRSRNTAPALTYVARREMPSVLPERAIPRSA